MPGIQTIQQGEHLPFQFDRDGESISGWTCTVTVKQFPDDAALVSRVITAGSDKWEGFLTQTETSALSPSSKTPYYLTGKLENTTTDQEIQIPLRFHVTESWA